MRVDIDDRAPAATLTAVRENDAVTGKPYTNSGTGRMRVGLSGETPRVCVTNTHLRKSHEEICCRESIHFLDLVR